MRIIVFIFLIFITSGAFGQRYWVASATGNWNNTANWSTTSGGAGGASVPGAADQVFFNGAGGSNGNCNLDVAPTVAGISVNGYSGTIDLLGFTLTTTGTNTFTSGTIANTGGAASLALNTTGTTTFNGTIFGANVTGTTGRLLFNGSTFNGTVSVTKSGTGNDNSTGNNIFNGVTTITNISDSQIMLGNGNPDQFNATTTFNNNGAYRFHFAQSHNGLTTTFTDLTLNTNKSGGTDQWSFFAGEGTNTSFSISGNLTINCAGTLQSNHRFLNGTGSTATYGGTVTVNNTNTNTATDITLGNNGTSTYNGNIVLTNTAGEIYFNAGASASSTQGATRSISVGGGGFTGGRIALRRFTQVSATQTLTLTGTSRIDVGPNSSFGGDLTITSPRIFLDGVSITGNAFFEKTGSTNDNSAGGNSISGTTTIVNSGDSEFNLADTNPDTYQGLVTINNSGTSRVQIGITSAGNLFNGGLTINHNGNASGSVNTIIARNGASTATINGTLTLTSNNANSNSGIIIANDGTVAINGNIVVNSTNGRGVYFGNASGSVTQSAGFGVASGTFNSGGLSFSRFTQSGAQPSTLTLTGSSSLTVGTTSEFGGNVSFTAPQVLLNGCTYQGTASIEKTGAGNNSGTGGNTFNGVTTLTNSGSGHLLTANNNPDIFNADLTVTNSGSNLIYLAHNSAGNQFNGNITLNSIGTSSGIYFSNNSGGSSTLAATRSISLGGSGFTAGELRIIRMTQLGTENTNLILGGASAVLRVGPNTTFGGDVDFRSPQLYLDGITVAGTSNLEKTGATNDASLGGNVFNGAVTVTNSGSGYLLFGNGSRDQFLSTAVFDNTGSFRIYFAHNHPGETTTFASSLTLNSNKSGGSDQYSYLIAENGTSSFSVGGAFAINCFGGIRSDFRLLNGTGSSATFSSTVTINNANAHPSTVIRMGENGTSTYSNNVSVANSGGSSGIIFNSNASASSTMSGVISAGTFSGGTLNLNRFTQTGTSLQTLTLTGSATLNIGPSSSFEGDVMFLAPSLLLNGTTYMGTTHLEKTGTTNDSGVGNNIFSGQAVIVNNGSGNLRTNGNNTFNGLTTIINNSSSDILLELSAGSAYNGNVTFTNNGSSTIRVGYQGTTTFAGNITVSNSGTGILFCESTGTATMASPGVITVGTGFSTGELRLRSFTQTGATAQTLTLTGSALLTLGPSSSFDGDVTFTSPRLLLHGTTYNGAAHLEKTSVGNDDGNGGNTFNQIATIVNSGDSYLRTGVSNPDVFQSTLTIVNSGASTIRLADNSAGNQFNGNIELNSTFGGGIYFCNNTNGTATLAATRTIAVGGFGVISGDVRLIRFTQVGATAQNLSLSGIATLTLGPTSTFGGDVNFSAPGLLLNGTTFDGVATLSKTGASNDGGTGGNIFNFSASITCAATASGQLITANSSPDTFNSNLNVSNFGSNIIYLANNTAGNNFNGNITFESGLGSGGIYFCNNSAAATATINTGGSLLVGGAGFIDGRLRLRRFSQLGGSAQAVTLTGTALFELGPSSSFSGNVDFRAPQFELDGTTFNGTTRLEKTGASNNDSQGDNVFNGVTTIANSGSGYFRFAVSALDQFNNDLILENTGTSTIRMADVIAGSVFDGNIQVNSTLGGGIYFGDNPPANATLTAGHTITVGSLGFSIGELRLDRFIQVGATPQNMTLTGTALLTIGPGSSYDGDVNFNAPQLALSGGTFNGAATLTKTGATGNTGTGGNIFNSTTVITNSGSGVLRTNGSNTFSGPTTIVNSGSADILLELNTGSTYNNTVTFTNTGTSNIRAAYNGANTFQDIIVNSTGGLGIYFCENAAGSASLAATRTITVGGTGFSGGDLRLDRFTQVGATAQSLTFTGNAVFRTRNSSVWNGNLTVSAPRIFVEGSTFNGTASFTKTDSNTDTNAGGNTFNGVTTFVNSGAGTFRLANSTGDNFNNHVTFNQTAGTIQPAYNVASNFAGNITVNGSSSITFAAAGGTANFTGGNAQAIIRSGSASPIFRRMQFSKSANTVTLNTDISGTIKATFVTGVLATDATNIINFADNATVTGGSNASHVDGPVRKIGNDVFSFPTGDGGIYRSIAISAPSNTTHTFTAEYFKTPQAFGNESTYDPSFYSVSSCEFWTLDRTPVVGGSNVLVTLSWNSSDCTGPYITDPSTLRVTRWNGSSWVNHGNGGTTGTSASGTIVSSGVITSFSPITLASTTSANPLPIELVEFVAIPNVTSVGLRWTTLSELNNDFFTIERSGSGVEFEELALIRGAGTTDQKRTYTYEDTKPLDGTSYYRLKQTDFDKSVSYSEIVKVNLEAPEVMVLYPNPVNQSEIVTANSTDVFALYNSLGQMVVKTEYTREIDTKGLPAGVYTVRSASGSVTRLVIR
ncbi:MAG: T9SS type A sorting domain-containing protein [Cyclobacteriaceae bacterium]